MPAIEFWCENCDHKFTIQSIPVEGKKVFCPGCLSFNVHQLIGRCSIYKNTNWFGKMQTNNTGFSLGGGGGG
ncbi:MAG: zinc ribbon domain-containing protein [Peptococcaceae bacterium]|nr:MAG: zinc ribbon domain-containing protein [Peptococcaceae bacterium]